MRESWGVGWGIYASRLWQNYAPVYNGQPIQRFQENFMLDRRTFLTVCSSLGLTTTLLPGVLWAMADEKGKVTRDMIDHAAAIAGVPIADEYKDAMLETLNALHKYF